VPVQDRIIFARTSGHPKVDEAGRAGLAKFTTRRFKSVTDSTEIALQKNNSATVRAQRPVADQGHMCRLKFFT
jgi:hypothetical protein